MPVRLVLFFVLLGPTLALAGNRNAQTSCVTYFGLEQADARITELLGNIGPLLKAGVVAPWPEGVDPLTAQTSATTVVEDKNHTASTIPSMVGNLPPAILKTRSWPLPKKEIEALEAWFSKKGAEQYPGLCLSPDKATYLLAIGIAVKAAPGNCPDIAFGPADDHGRGEWNDYPCSLQVTSAFLFQKLTGSASGIAPTTKPQFYYFVLSEWSNSSPYEVKSPGGLNFYTLRPTFIAMLKHLSSIQTLPGHGR